MATLNEKFNGLGNTLYTALRVGSEFTAAAKFEAVTVWSVSKATEHLEKNRIPVYDAPENAVRCFLTMNNYSDNIDMLHQTPATIPHAFKPETEKNRSWQRDKQRLLKQLN